MHSSPVSRPEDLENPDMSGNEIHSVESYKPILFCIVTENRGKYRIKGGYMIL